MRRGLDPARAANARLLARVNRPAEQANVPEDVMVARKRQPQVATQRVSLKPAPGGKSVKANQAWKYPGNNIVRADSVLLNGRYYTDPKEHGDDIDAAASKQGQKPEPVLRKRHT